MLLKKWRRKHLPFQIFFISVINYRKLPFSAFTPDKFRSFFCFVFVFVFLYFILFYFILFRFILFRFILFYK